MQVWICESMNLYKFNLGAVASPTGYYYPINSRKL